MGNKSWLTHMSCGVLAAAVAFGGAGCLVSGFRVEEVSLFWVFCWSAVLAGAGVAAFHFRKVPFLLLALPVGAFFAGSGLVSSVLALVWHVSDVYSRAYGWLRIGAYGADMTLALCLLCTVSELLTLTVVYRGGGIWAAVTVGVLPLAACLVVTDTAPGEFYLFLLLLGLILLVMSQELRSREKSQAAALLRYLALPVGTFLLALLLLFPRETYALQDGAEKLESFVKSLAQQAEQIRLPEEPPAFSDILPSSQVLSSRVDLETVGRQKKSTDPTMEVTLARSGTTYLRGYAYAEYTGTRWLSGNQSGEEGLWASEGTLTYAGTVTVRTRKVHPVLYIPYYSGTALPWKTENTQRLTQYTMTQYWLPGAEPSGSYPEGTEVYLQLPEATRKRAEGLVFQILGESVPVDPAEGLAEKVSRIAAFVRNSADYDLNTPRMPQSETDFALWFLTESDTGYCVHFATAATVLLRAAGIPARYVTGYMASGRAGETVTVTEGDAHAWVEYCLPGLGWTVLEATPGTSAGTQMQTQPGEEPSQPSQSATEPSPGETKPGTVTLPGETVQDPEKATDLDLTWVWKALIPLLLAGAVAGQWQLRLYLRRRKQSRGDPNARALAMWQEYTLLQGLLKEKPEKAIHTLAQKAKFSQYSIAEEELAAIAEAMEGARARLQEKPLPLRLVHRFLFAAY